MTNYYRELGVKRDAELPAIKGAFRKIARKSHPDVSRKKDGAERFKRARAAYEVLSNPAKRAEYDAQMELTKKARRTSVRREGQPLASDFAEFRPWQDQPGWGEVFELFDESEPTFIERILSDLGFDRDGLFSEVSRKRDIPVSAEVELSEEESQAGCGVPIQAHVEVACERCGGIGRRGLYACLPCRGTGTRDVLLDAVLQIPPGVRHGDRITVPLRARGLDLAFIRVKVLLSRASSEE